VQCLIPGPAGNPISITLEILNAGGRVNQEGMFFISSLFAEDQESHPLIR